MKRGLVRNRDGLVAGLDIGCSKVCCFIARSETGRAPRILGIGQQASRGVKGGAIVDMAAAEAAIRSAVHAAEQMAGETIDSVVVNLSAGAPTSRSVDVEVPINGAEVADLDLRRAFEHGHEAHGVNGHAVNGHQLIHSIPTAFRIDEHRGIRDPLGMVGDRLGVTIHMVTAGAGAVQNLTTCIQRCHLDIAAFVASPYASGLAVLVPDEMELGVTVIDMGGGTTTITVFHENNPIYTDLIPVGGNHVTNDIARGLSTPVSHAERIKTLYGHAMAAGADDRELIDVPQVGEEDGGHTHQVPRSLLVGIIQPRLEETFELVRSHLEVSGAGKIAGRRVVLTGGACQLSGLSDLAALILDKQIRIGRPIGIDGLAEATGGPAYAACAGLLNYAISANTAAPRKAQPLTGEPNGLFGRFGLWVREHF